MALSKAAVLFLLSFVILETSVLIHLYLTAVFPQTNDNGPSSSEVRRLFTAYDTNADGVIDLREFEDVKERIDEALQMEDNGSYWNVQNIESKFEQLKNTSGEIVKLKAEFTPLVLDSMTKFNDDQGGPHESMQALSGLRQWQKVVIPEAEFAVELFKSFLPKRKNVKIGESWMIITTKITKFGPDLSSNRYSPPSVNGNEIAIHYLLQMFHPRPFIYTRFPPQGSTACIRAQNHEFFELEFRIHAEYQLNRPPLLPFWFSPAQFSGRLVIAKNGSHIHTFEMEVPNNRSLNIDMEWLTGQKDIDHLEEPKSDEVHDAEQQMNMEVDIGYLPEMRVYSMAPSYLLGEESDIQDKKRDIIWDQEISREEARSILEKKLYPFKKVPYLSYEKAYKKAEEEKKLVHSIVLWGALDDQSC